MLFTLFILFLVIFSVISVFVSLVFMLAPGLYAKMDELLGCTIGSKTTVNSALEGRIDIVDKWVMSHRAIVGSLLCVLSAINTRNAILLGGF